MYTQAKNDLVHTTPHIMSSSLTSGWNIDVESETVLLLFFDECRKSFAPGQLTVGQSRLVQVRRRLRTDRSMFQRHTHAVPFLHRSGRRHETQLTAVQWCILEAEVDLDTTGWSSGWRRICDGDKDPTQTSVLGLDHPRTHLRRYGGGGDRSNAAT